MDLVGPLGQHFPEHVAGLWVKLLPVLPQAPLLEDAPRGPRVPVIGVRLELHQFQVAQLSHVHRLGLHVAVGHFVNPPVGAVVDVGVGAVALVEVVPVDEIDAAVRARAEVDHLRPAVVEVEEVRAVMPDEAGAFGLGHVHVDALAVDVPDEDFAAVLGRPVAALVDHQPRVRVPAAGGVGAPIRRVGALVAGVVDVVGGLPDVVEGERVEVLPGLALVTPALDDVPQVRDDARLGPELAVLVEIDAPGVACALREHLELVLRRVVAPDAGVDFRPLEVARARLAHVGVGEHAMAPVEPAVGAPGEGVERLMGVLVGETVEQDLGRAIGLVVAILVGDEEQVRGRADPDAAEAHFKSADKIQPLGENGPILGHAVAVRVFQNDDAVFALPLGLANWVGHPLSHPEPSPRVDRHRDRLHDVRLAGEHRRLKARRQRHRGDCLLRLKSRKLHHVHRRGGHDLLRVQLVRQLRPIVAFVKHEVVEVEVAPVALALVDQLDVKLPADVPLHVHHDWVKRLVLVAGVEGVEGQVVIGAAQLHPRLLPRAAGDEEAGPAVGDFERRAGERADAVVAQPLEPADPELALVVALLVAAALGHHVAPDRLLVKRVAAGRPVAQVAGLEVQVQHVPVAPDGADGSLLGLRLPMRRDRQDHGRGQSNNKNRRQPSRRAAGAGRNHSFFLVPSVRETAQWYWRPTGFLARAYPHVPRV